MTEAPQEHDTSVAFVFFCFGPFEYDTPMTPLLSMVEQAAENQWLLLRLQQERHSTLKESNA